ncbi:LrgB family protein [Castellaniella caeni]|uniref:LrgB family protein n=1 Tax=Castellaniella caeni TaxID=266123 RepID=UPI00083062C0|nr:LrgB family protein [Castellaniella caeni]
MIHLPNSAWLGWLLGQPVLGMVFWSAVTVLAYLFAKKLYGRYRQWWLMPLALAPALLIIVVLLTGLSYQQYIRDTGWLVALLGPATVAFAVPIYEQRALIRTHWPVLLVGMLVGSLTALATAWGLANLMGLDDSLRLSLMPRSISTPFAMQMSGDIGGVPDLTAVFVVVTGVFGALVGHVLLAWLPTRSVLARGSLLGVGAHAAGTAAAYELGREEGSIAGLVMVLMGLLNVVGTVVVMAL